MAVTVRELRLVARRPWGRHLVPWSAAGWGPGHRGAGRHHGRYGWPHAQATAERRPDGRMVGRQLAL